MSLDPMDAMIRDMLEAVNRVEKERRNKYPTHPSNPDNQPFGGREIEIGSDKGKVRVNW